jgi:hypothetical protein
MGYTAHNKNPISQGETKSNPKNKLRRSLGDNFDDLRNIMSAIHHKYGIN